MSKFYFTFGQSHTHSIYGVTLDKDAVVEIESNDPDKARDEMFRLFGPKWSMQYAENAIDMRHYPRGVLLSVTGPLRR